ncbi:MAG: SUMF1/EgtB/PvdO family nonheme iron enzyme [Saprospiraceae bacterium]
MKKIVAFLCVAGLALPAGVAQPEMVPVPGGGFVMGFARGDADEKPLHAVELDSFLISATEVTVAQYRAFAESSAYRSSAETGDGSYTWDSLGWHKMEGLHWRYSETGRLRSAGEVRYPVLHVSWYDAVHYCNWLSENAGLRAVYTFQGDSVSADLTAEGFRLPTEAEWEYAAAEGQTPPKSIYAGAGSLGALAWYSGNSGKRAHPVAQKKANALGIYDLSGNVWEWCHDWYDGRYYEKSARAGNPGGPAHGEMRVLRGGSWNNSGKHCRIANRTSRYPDFRDGSVGFRVVRSVKGN